MQGEHIIRDWLVANPEFIERGLQVLSKEYYLPDDIGASGFIDILCKDLLNNFVIIEIKRSDSTARQTFTEVFKYAELIQVKHSARHSEIRIIVISTHWDQIIRAFSFSSFKSPFAIKGLKIYINAQTKIPERIEEVQPISSVDYPRRFMQSQILYLFATKEKCHRAHEILDQKLQKANFGDYVTIELEAPTEKVLHYRYALNVAFQKQSMEQLLSCITLLEGTRHLDMEENEFENRDEYHSYLEQVLIAALEMGQYSDTVEAGYGEKFESIIGVQNWQVTSINRHGIFKSDPRYDDDLLLKELKGHDGNSSNKFVALSESNQKERIKEIRTECQHCLIHTPEWAAFIDHLIVDLQTSSKKFRLLVDIYNPDSIVTALFYTLIKGNPDYLPRFKIFVDYYESTRTEVYVGEILSFGGVPRLKLFTSTDYNEISNEVLRVRLDPDNQMDALRMGLRYAISKTVFIEDKEESNQFVFLDEDSIVYDDTQYSSLEEYIVRNQNYLMLMVNNYSRVYTAI